MMITGEIYETDETNISAVDRLEGHPHIYTRQNIEKGFKTKKINHINILRPPVLIRYKIVNFSQSIRTLLRFRRSFSNILKAFRIKGPGQFLFSF